MTTVLSTFIQIVGFVFYIVACFMIGYVVAGIIF